MTFKLANLESITPAEAELLWRVGVATTEDILRQASGQAARDDLAARSEVAEATLRRLVRLSDLMRISGINEAHAQLLETLGAGTVGELARHDATLLIKAMRRRNVELTLVRSVPPESTVARWIADARSLQPILEL